MKGRIPAFMIVMFVCAVFTIVEASAEDRTDADGGWPKTFKTDDGTVFTISQPQIDSWDGYDLKSYEAVEVRLPGSWKTLYGVAYLSAHTIVDKGERLVLLEDQTVTAVKFASAKGEEASILKKLRKTCPEHIRTISLDRMEASLAVARPGRKSDPPVNNNPPRIIFSDKPAVLVYIDGEPHFRPVKGTSLSRVINTRVLLVRDPAGNIFLRLFDGYMESPSFSGPWANARVLPAGIKTAEGDALNSGQVDLLEGQGDPLTGEKPSLGKVLPMVFVSTSPAELIVTSGPPKYAPVGGTHLLYMENTTANVFKDADDQKNYVLISGRWFRSGSIAGPWEYVPAGRLPAGFARIPDDSVKENVKASIPGTRQAEEAVIADSIPETARIDRKGTAFTPQIDGGPQLRPIAGTSLHYVINSPDPIIELNGYDWYACSRGVWFSSTNLEGPWAVADSVPEVIYTIPPGSPVYYVTFVRVYSANEDSVLEGYTPGYYGCVVTPDDVVVYGTGYSYTPWIGTNWYCPPVTYGSGSELCWTPWDGWSYAYGFGCGWGWGPYWYYPPVPWWGPYRSWRSHVHHGMRAWGPGGWANTTSNIYRLWGRNVRESRGVSESEPIPANPKLRRYGMAYNSTTRRLVAGPRGSVRSASAGTQPNARLPERGKAPESELERESHIGRDMYASPNGNVYLHRDREGRRAWEHMNPSEEIPEEVPGHVPSGHPVPKRITPGREGPGREEPEHVAPEHLAPEHEIPRLEQERSAREIGGQHEESFEAHRPSGREPGGREGGRGEVREMGREGAAGRK